MRHGGRRRPVSPREICITPAAIDVRARARSGSRTGDVNPLPVHRIISDRPGRAPEKVAEKVSRLSGVGAHTGKSGPTGPRPPHTEDIMNTAHNRKKKLLTSTRAAAIAAMAVPAA